MPKNNDIRLCVLLIATRKYKTFLRDIITQIDNLVLPDRDIAIMVFADEEIIFPNVSSRVQLIFMKIGSYGFPYATLYRYKIFSSISVFLSKFTHLLYLDVDMKIVDVIGEEIIVDGLLVIEHPGNYASSGWWGSSSNPQKSTSWFPEVHRKKYYCGGVQGGSSKKYLEASKVMAERIETDEKNKIMAEWHDETHWNKVTNYDSPQIVTVLTAAYCVPEQKKARIGINDIKPKIIALDKNHKEIRS